MTGEQAPRPDFAFPAHVYFKEVDGQMVLLNLENEQYYGLDPVGTDIVKRLTAQPTEAALVDLIADYEVEPAVLRQDVAELVNKLVAAGLLATQGAST